MSLYQKIDVYERPKEDRKRSEYSFVIALICIALGLVVASARFAPVSTDSEVSSESALGGGGQQLLMLSELAVLAIRNQGVRDLLKRVRRAEHQIVLEANCRRATVSGLHQGPLHPEGAPRPFTPGRDQADGPT